MTEERIRFALAILKRYVEDMERFKERRPGETASERLLRSMDARLDENQEYWEDVASGAVDALSWALGAPDTATGELLSKLAN